MAKPRGAPKAVPPAQAKPAAVAWTPPARLSKADRAARYPNRRRLRKKARKLNSDGAKARRSKDHATAITLYKSALEVAPGYVTPRFNLACEYGLKGDADAVITELEHLFRIGTQRARRFLAKAAIDSDFDPVRRDPRMAIVASQFSVDFDQPIIKQLCRDSGRVVSLIDAGNGVFDFPEAARVKQLTGGKARSRIYKLLDNGAWCEGDDFLLKDPEHGRRNADSVLSKWTGKYTHRCLTRHGLKPGAGTTLTLDEAGFSERLCFVHAGGSWNIAATARASDGGEDLTSFWRAFKRKALAKATAAASKR